MNNQDDRQPKYPMNRRAFVSTVIAGGGKHPCPEHRSCCADCLRNIWDLKEHALPLVKANIAAWLREAEAPDGLDAIIVNTSGCGTSLKAYGHALRLDPVWKDKAARVSALAKDISEFMAQIGLQKPQNHRNLRVVYHSACSMQHGQRIVRQPLDLLRAAGFEVLEVPDGFMCCGSAGVYNLLQPEIASELKARKVANIRSVDADVAASGNIGCMTQLAEAVGIPFLHTVELLDWATGGPEPEAITDLAKATRLRASEIVQLANA
jgi:glycolate oxidase iron-sulfur subunit